MATVMPTTQGYRAPGPYDEDYRSIARREQMAQILQQQALQPIEVGAYQGIQAPISPLSGIAKILQKLHQIFLIQLECDWSIAWL